jgi:hypothetical protein
MERARLAAEAEAQGLPYLKLSREEWEKKYYHESRPRP